MNKSIKDILSKIEQSNGLRIGIAFVIIIVLVVYFLPEQKKQDELARLAKKGDWKELIEKSSDYLKKEQTPKAFYYKAKGYFQLFKKESSRVSEQNSRWPFRTVCLVGRRRRRKMEVEVRVEGVGGRLSSPQHPGN